MQSIEENVRLDLPKTANVAMSCMVSEAEPKKFLPISTAMNPKIAKSYLPFIKRNAN